jgi:hypothetical protein
MWDWKVEAKATPSSANCGGKFVSYSKW